MSLPHENDEHDEGELHWNKVWDLVESTERQRRQLFYYGVLDGARFTAHKLLWIRNHYTTHESGGVVVPGGLGVSHSFKRWVSLNNLIFKITLKFSSFRKKTKAWKWLKLTGFGVIFNMNELLTKRDELSFLVVLALPIASSGGLAWITWSSRLPWL